MASPSNQAHSRAEVRDPVEHSEPAADLAPGQTSRRAYQRRVPLDDDMVDLENTIHRLQSEFCDRRNEDRPLAGSVAHAYQVTIEKYYARLERCNQRSAQDQGSDAR